MEARKAPARRKNWQRAIDDLEKSARSQDILGAALKLFEKQPGTLPSVSDIARVSGLGKGTVYLYFKTKEEIFLGLLGDKYALWTRQIAEALDRAALERTDRARIAIVREAIADFCLANETFLRLACRSQAVIEQNLTRDAALGFKTALAAQVAHASSRADRAFPTLARRPGAATRLLLGTYALLTGLWQMCDAPRGMSRLREVPGLAPLFPRFDWEVGPAIEAYWTGYLGLAADW